MSHYLNSVPGSSTYHHFPANADSARQRLKAQEVAFPLPYGRHGLNLQLPALMCPSPDLWEVNEQMGVHSSVSACQILFQYIFKKILVSKFDAENILDIVFCKRIVVMLPFHKACVLRDVLTTTIRPGLGQSHEQGIPVGFPVWVTGAPGICVAFHCLHSSINKNLD